MKYGIGISLIIVVLWSAIALLQLWFSLLAAHVFIKLTVSAVLIIAAVLLVALGIREYLSDKDLKSKGFIDE
ncbi:hypothetical protein [Methylomonas methanica]|uniref:Uncharacterized protein n=1 Tax=Methylomonas methanica (strain DSM 25384 / MC09) TaxID=857087 RepID=G0A4Q9_METMM|nr:hypothetical protein [Methylomonas methanica]AEG02800.1 hypothetical protein, putative exported membran protein, putative cation/multidrug efflux pump [Methylomonas methanica MC09]